MRRQNLNFLIISAAAIFFVALISPVTAGTVRGRMLLQDGKPIVGGVGLFFDSRTGPAPDPDKDFRAPEYVYIVDDDGNFQGELAAGKYYLIGAIEARPGSGQEKDLFFLIRDVKNEPLLIQVPEEGIVELGTLSAAESHQ